MRNVTLVIAVVIFSVVIGCRQDEPPTKKVVTDSVRPALDTAQTPDTNAVPTTVDTSVDSFARVLAGVTPLKGHEQYATEMRSRIARFSSGELQRMRSWASSQLSRESTSDVVFYPFSGPDALNLLALFPDAKHYVMVAAEPAGTFPKLSRMHNDSLTTYLHSVAKATRLVYGLGYFITDSMRKDIRQTIVDGAVPLISLFLVQMGNTLLGYDRTVVQSSDSVPTQQVLHDLYFRRDSSGNVQRLTYIEANIGNNVYMGHIPLPKNGALLKFLNDLPPCATFVKSASYLMHTQGFSAIRNLVLQKSYSILQDDSGIPYAAFDRTWSFSFYGEYQRPIRMFAGRYQEDLDSAMAQSTDIKPGLPFRYGYLFRKDGQNVIKAMKR